MADQLTPSSPGSAALVSELRRERWVPYNGDDAAERAYSRPPGGPARRRSRRGRVDAACIGTGRLPGGAVRPSGAAASA